MNIEKQIAFNFIQKAYTTEMANKNISEIGLEEDGRFYYKIFKIHDFFDEDINKIIKLKVRQPRKIYTSMADFIRLIGGDD